MLQFVENSVEGLIEKAKEVADTINENDGQPVFVPSPGEESLEIGIGIYDVCGKEHLFKNYSDVQDPRPAVGVRIAISLLDVTDNKYTQSELTRRVVEKINVPKYDPFD